ncbi:MAG: hypothetical protein ACFCVH_23135 [Alphaproteobacteria bacterium]
MAPHDDHHHNHHLIGHNGPPRPHVQWQTPHRPDAPAPDTGRAPEPRDFDLVEAAFVEGFHAATDPVSFLRLAGVPFLSRDADGRRLALLRVELARTTDLGALTPTIGGGESRYDPLPATLVSHRSRLGLVYARDGEPVTVTLAAARSLPNLTPEV